MKSAYFIPFLLLLVVTPAFGQLLSDRTGLAKSFDIQAGGHTFEIKSVSNYDVIDYKFDEGQKKLTLSISSGLENNLGELIIPKTLLSGDFSFYLNDMQFNPKIKSNDKISFITMNFTGTGNHKIDIVASDVLLGVSSVDTLDDKPETIVSEESPSNGGGCLIATATYGTEMAPQIQQLREIRDQKLLKTDSGQYFMNHFNNFYYSFSPIVADYERENPLFKESVKLFLTPMISSLSIMNYVQIDSELEVVGVGLSVIALNVSMYFLAPVMIIMRLKK